MRRRTPWALRRDPLPADPVIERYKLSVDRTLLRANLELSVEERMANLVALQALAAEARRAGEAAGLGRRGR
jgi:hypothetical protein